MGGGGQDLCHCTMTEKYSYLIGNIEGQYINFPFRLFSDKHQVETKDFHVERLNYV